MEHPEHCGKPGWSRVSEKTEKVSPMGDFYGWHFKRKLTGKDENSGKNGNGFCNGVHVACPSVISFLFWQLPHGTRRHNMKIIHFALCIMIAVVSLPASLYASGPENPVAGSIRRLYALHANNVGSEHSRWFQETVEAILGNRVAPYSTAVDTSSSGFRVLNGNELGMWTGWIQCRNRGVYTIAVNRSGRLGPAWYLCSLWVNGRCVLSAQRGAIASVNVSLHAGFNDICLIAEGSSNIDNHVELTLKRSDSIKDPSVLSPGALWHEDELDEDDEGGDWVPATTSGTSTSTSQPTQRRAPLNWQDFITDYAP